MWMLLLLLQACPSEPLVEGKESSDTDSTFDEDGDGHDALASGGDDCDDLNNDIFPGATELCDAVDNNCDGFVDEGFDQDGDGFLTDETLGCRNLGITDCDDQDAATGPGAPETCDGVDNDCDGMVDEDPKNDLDQDGYSNCGGDCDDANVAIHPDAPEICDALDNNCDGLSDEGFDEDGDGVGYCAGDCNDDDWTVSPLIVEVCDGKDNNCDGDIDEGFDVDDDGFAVCRGDCDDSDPKTNPWAIETCDGADNDCNGLVDDMTDLDGDGVSGCSDCDDTNAAIYPGAVEACDLLDNDCDGVIPNGEVDQDGDGAALCHGDCDDTDATRSPLLPEICDGLDNDCDPATSEAVDNDGDGISACDGDCDDGDASEFPGGVEICDFADNNCDGVVDENGICGSCVPAAWGAHDYLFCADSLAWSAARTLCTDIPGFDLVAFADRKEEVWVSDTASTVVGGSWWVGFTDVAQEGNFVWSNGDPVSYTDWAAGEPNNSGNEDCAQILWSGYQWNDATCASALPFVCESM